MVVAITMFMLKLKFQRLYLFMCDVTKIFEFICVKLFRKLSAEQKSLIIAFAKADKDYEGTINGLETETTSMLLKARKYDRRAVIFDSIFTLEEKPEQKEGILRKIKRFLLD